MSTAESKPPSKTDEPQTYSHKSHCFFVCEKLELLGSVMCTSMSFVGEKEHSEPFSCGCAKVTIVSVVGGSSDSIADEKKLQYLQLNVIK